VLGPNSRKEDPARWHADLLSYVYLVLWLGACKEIGRD
jgi:hypothetical protein